MPIIISGNTNTHTHTHKHTSNDMPNNFRLLSENYTAKISFHFPEQKISNSIRFFSYFESIFKSIFFFVQFHNDPKSEIVVKIKRMNKMIIISDHYNDFLSDDLYIPLVYI